MLLFALLNESAIAQYSITQIGQNNTLLELNPFLHGAATPAPSIPKPQATLASRQPRSAPERPQASRLAVAKPSVRAQEAVKQEAPADKAAGRRPANTQKIQIARPLTPPSPTAAVACATNAVASAPALVQVVAPARQIPETPEPVVAVVATVTAGPPAHPNAGNPTEVKPVSTPPGATNKAEGAPDPAEVVTGTVAAGPPAQPNAGNSAEVKPISTPPGATNTAERAPESIEVVAPARQTLETPEPVVAVVGTIEAEPPAR